MSKHNTAIAIWIVLFVWCPPSSTLLPLMAVSLQELSNRANDLGLEYGLEVVNRYETNLANTAYEVSSAIGDWNRRGG